MSTYNTYNDNLENRIANTSEVFFDEAMKKTAINESISSIAQMYSLPELQYRTTIDIDANGEADVPADMMKMIRLWDESATTGVATNKYEYIDPLSMDDTSPTSAYFWTIDNAVGGTDRKIIVRPVVAKTLQIRYYKFPTELSDSTDDSGLSPIWDEAVVAGAVYRVYENAGRYNEAMGYKEFFMTAVRRAWNYARNVGGVKENKKVKSIYSRKRLLG